MDLNVFTDPVVGDYYDRHFVGIKYDELTEVGERALSQLDAGEVDPAFLFFIERLFLEREFGADS